MSISEHFLCLSVYLPYFQSFHQSICVPVDLCISISIFSSLYLCTCRSIYIYLFISQSDYVSIHFMPVYLSFYLSNSLYEYPITCLFICLSNFLSILPCVCRSVCHALHRYLHTCLVACLTPCCRYPQVCFHSMILFY